MNEAIPVTSVVLSVASTVLSVASAALSVTSTVLSVTSATLSVSTIHLHAKSPRHTNVPRAKNYSYIFSGADTPIRRRAFAIVVRTAVISAKRASVSSLFEASSTFSAL